MKINSVSSQIKTGGLIPAVWFQRLRKMLSSDWGVLLLLALGWGLFLTIVVVIASRQYGFHRDELALFDNGQHLAWGYVEYPPLAPFLAHIGLALFGLSLVALRLFPILAACLVLLLTGLMARELGGARRAQIVAGLAAVTAPVLLFDGLFFSYETFDYLWWVVIAYLMIRLLKSENPRWWLAIGAAIGLGAMTKYTISLSRSTPGTSALGAPACSLFSSPSYMPAPISPRSSCGSPGFGITPAARKGKGSGRLPGWRPCLSAYSWSLRAGSIIRLPSTRC